MAKKVSLIGFVKSKYKSVKYDSRTLELGTYIKFFYGPGEKREYWKPMIGKVSNIYHNGVECRTDYGIYNPAFERIDRIFVPKITGKLQESRLKYSSNMHLPLLDAAMQRVRDTFKYEYPEIKIRSNRRDSFSVYRFCLVFSYKRQKIMVELEDGNARTISIYGYGIKTPVKVGINKTKVNVRKIINKVKTLYKIEEGLITL